MNKNNIRTILNDEKSINLGSVYETVVASELIAHNHKLFYYDNRNKGEVDYLIDDYDTLSVVPIEVKSGKDYMVHSALNTFIKNEDYNKDEEVETPKTGDNTPIIVMIGCMLVVLANSLQIVLSANKKPKEML